MIQAMAMRNLYAVWSAWSLCLMTFPTAAQTWIQGPCQTVEYCFSFTEKPVSRERPEGAVENLLASDNRLYAIGTFDWIDATPASRVAVWDQNQWRALSSGLNRGGEALASYRGEIYMGGFFTHSGDGRTQLNRVAKWDGQSILPVGAGFDAPVRVLHNHTYLDGREVLVAGGQFKNSGNSAINNIAEWDGISWKNIGAGLNGNVYALTSFFGNLIAGGNFSLTENGPKVNVAYWNGTNWQVLGAGLSASVYGLTVYNSRIVATGDFTRSGSIQLNYVARLIDGQWRNLGTGFSGTGAPYGRALAVYQGVLIAGGNFIQAGSTPVQRVAYWNGTDWGGLGDGLNSWVEAFTIYSGQLHVAGWFLHSATGPKRFGKLSF